MLLEPSPASLFYNYNQTLQPVPEPFAGAYVPCQPTEEWLYECGPGTLVAAVRFRCGKVLSIIYGRSPRRVVSQRMV